MLDYDDAWHYSGRGAAASRSRKQLHHDVQERVRFQVGTPPQSLVDCMSHGTVPIIIGKHHKTLGSNDIAAIRRSYLMLSGERSHCKYYFKFYGGIIANGPRKAL